MLEEVKEALRTEWAKQEIIGFNESIIDGYTGFIFQNRYGDPLSPHSVNRAIDRIIAENPGKTVAVTTHGGVIKNLNARVEFGNIQGLRQGKVFGNTSVSVLEAEDGVLRWKSVNDMSHLPEELRRAPMQYTFHTEAL